MFPLVVVICVLCILAGVGLSVALFGTGVKRARAFQDIYFTQEEENGVGVIYTMLGEYSSVIALENPVQKYCADVDCYYDFNTLMTNIVQTLGEGYALHKQDIFVHKHFDMKAVQAGGGSGNFLSDAYFRHFDGREYMDNITYIIITQENRRSVFANYSQGKWRDFTVKVGKVLDQLHSSGVRDARLLGGEECRRYVERYFALDFRSPYPSMENFRSSDEGIMMGGRQVKMFSLLDVDDVGLPSKLRPYMNLTVNNTEMPVDIMGGLSTVPDVDTLVYNQVFFLPNQKYELARLDRKKNRHANFRGAGNKTAAEDIAAVQEVIAKENKQLVYAHFNIAVVADRDKDMQKISNYLDNLLSRQNIHLSKRAYNQVELFIATFPGNVYRLNHDYDRFLTLSEAAMCLMYKERQSKTEDTPLKFYFTDRAGIPLAIDLTGKTGKVKHTDNMNFFVLGPSGSGKSFTMNTVIRQYYEQGTDCVIVDTGDSYEGICAYFGGTYISYTRERPISMNPFKVSPTEYNENFEEKKLFLKNLIFLIYSGSKEISKLEEYIINKVIVEYYREYFTPFDGFKDSERDALRQDLILQTRKDYERIEEEVEESLSGDTVVSAADRERYERLREREDKLQRKIDDSASTEAEKDAARRKKEEAHSELMRMNDIVEQKYGKRIERRIARMEEQRRKLRVSELCFNTFYEYAIQRIPEITHDEHISFNINEFAAILKPFYRGGELEYTLNNDMDKSLFDERLIIFEIDKIKDDPVLFPIVTLIIMDVFTQKMRIKKDCRKCLVIEEAWKAIATPVMAEYIKYLYKTARKHNAMVGVVTQELQDIISSPIVKEAIINNSDIVMLLDQAKFKDKFDDIKAVLSLTDTECKKLFTVNRLDNKSGRPPFKELFIKRVDTSDVFGVEEPRECYMSYTTEKFEKEALKLYRRELRCSYQQAIEAFIRDWDASGIRKSLDFATKVMSAGHVLSGGRPPLRQPRSPGQGQVHR